VYCQLEYLSKCLPGRIRHALDELPDTLDGTYERTLEEINDRNLEFAQRLLQCVAVVSRPLRVEELAEFLAFDFKTGPIPKYREDWRLADPVEAVLSTCSTLLTLVDDGDSLIIQFSHFSVKEFLTSPRFAERRDIISRRYHISPIPAHTLVSQACLGILLHLDKNVTRDSLTEIPLAQYAAEHWFEHARFNGVSRKVEEGMKQLFDQRKPHLAVWLWICDPTVPSWWRIKSRPFSPHGTSLHYAAFCGLDSIVNDLSIEHPEDVNSRSFENESTPLHLTLEGGHLDIAWILLKHGADATAQTEDGWTPLHGAASQGYVELARYLVEHGADTTARTVDGWTPLHGASEGGHVELARLLTQHGADATAQTSYGSTPLHGASEGGNVDLAQLLFEHGAGESARTEDGWTPLHRASKRGHVSLTRLLIKHGADVAARTEDGWTALHWASERGHVELAQLLLQHGADVTARTSYGSTPLHEASSGGHVKLARLLLEHGADAATRTSYWLTPLHRASKGGPVELARLLFEHGADASAQTKDRWTALHGASELGHVRLARLLLEHGADVAAQAWDGSTPLQRASEWDHAGLVQLLIEYGLWKSPGYHRLNN
jgi:ankyrin repeat protein